MKTHQEIRDAIESVAQGDHTGRPTRPILCDILHALNDRIEALEINGDKTNSSLRAASDEIQSLDDSKAPR